MNPDDIITASPAYPPVTKEWLDTAFDWLGRNTYGEDTYFKLKINDACILTVHHSGQLWISEDLRSDEVSVGYCHTTHALQQFVAALIAVQ